MSVKSSVILIRCSSERGRWMNRRRRQQRTAISSPLTKQKQNILKRFLGVLVSEHVLFSSESRMNRYICIITFHISSQYSQYCWWWRLERKRKSFRQSVSHQLNILDSIYFDHWMTGRLVWSVGHQSPQGPIMRGKLVWIRWRRRRREKLNQVPDKNNHKRRMVHGTATAAAAELNTTFPQRERN